jgi:hypothetical protein
MLDTIKPVNIPETVSFTKLEDKVSNPTVWPLGSARPTMGLTYMKPYFFLSPDEGKRTIF